MGMTIDDIIQSLTAMKSVIGVNQLTINEAVDTMRKYQKIVQITRDFQQIHPHYGDSYYLQIREVIEDGKID